MFRRITILTVFCLFPARALADYNPTPAQLDAVVAEARTWIGTPYKFGGNDKKGIDCSHLVHAAYSKVFNGFPYQTASDYHAGPLFRGKAAVRRGEVIFWPAKAKEAAHIGIVSEVAPNGAVLKFIGAQSGGVAETACSNYWATRDHFIIRLK